MWTASADGRPLGVPRVEVALNGNPTPVMVDTGASQHFVLAAAAWAYDVPSEPFGSLATDAHGARFEVRLAARGSMVIPGERPFVPPFLFLLESDSLASTGVLGGLAPQLLAPVGHASLLDLVGGRLRVVERASVPTTPSVGRVCRAGPDSRDGWRYVVDVRVAGQRGALLLDTGAETTTVYARSPLAPMLLEGRRTERIRIAGAASVVQMRAVDDVPIALGGASVDTRVTVGPGHGQCGEDGLLGFDVLRRCRLAMHDDGVGVTCTSGDAPLHRAPPRRASDPLVLARIDADPACGRARDELTPTLDAPLPHRFESAVDAYVALSPEVSAHAARIEETCRSEGFLEARVREPFFRRNGGELRVQFSVEEGRRFTVQRVTVSVAGDDGARQLSPQTFPWLRTQIGQPYRREHLLADVRALADALVAEGAEVADAGFGHNEHENATVDVHFVVALAGALPERADARRTSDPIEP